MDIFKSIEEIIGLPFLREDFEDSSVCFENNEDLRDDFKVHFTAYDIVNYAYGIIYQSYSQEDENPQFYGSLEIPYPLDAAYFWQYSNLGKKHRIKQPIEELELANISELNWCRT